MSLVDPKRQTQGDKDISELLRGKNPSKSKKNTTEDTRNILEKVQQEGPSAGGKPGGTPDDPDGSGTGDSDKCGGCDTAGDIGCELGKFSCEMTSSMGDNLPYIGIAIGGVLVLLLAMKL